MSLFDQVPVNNASSGLFQATEWAPNPAQVDVRHPTAVKAINLIKFMMASAVKPQGQRPQRNFAIKFPMDEDAFHLLFPDAVAFKVRGGDHPVESRVNTVRTHRRRFNTARDAEYLFGREWYQIHHFNNVGVYVGAVVFTLSQSTTYQFMTERDHLGNLSLIPGTRTGLTVSFLSISFLFAREIRPTAKDPFSDRVDWKIRVEELMDRIHPRRLRLRSSDKIATKN